MADTVEDSLRSIVSQTTDEYEILVLDGGSTDGSLDIIRELQAEWDNIRLIEFPPKDDELLGYQRQLCIERARGEYILTFIDCDDKYLPGILDFVEVYHQINSKLNREILLKGRSIVIGKKELFDQHPIRNLAVGEDKDLFRRLYSSDSIIELKHERFFYSLGYDQTKSDSLKYTFKQQKSNFKTSISVRSYVEWLLSSALYRDKLWRGVLYELSILPISYTVSRLEDSFNLPPEFRTKGRLAEISTENQMTLSEIESAFDLDIERDRLSEYGEQIFYGDNISETGISYEFDDDIQKIPDNVRKHP